MDGAVDFFENGFISVVEELGLKWGPNPRELFFYRRPILHIIEFFVFHAFCVLCHKLAPTYFRDTVVKKPARSKSFSVLDVFLGLVYLACWCSQIILKAMRPKAHIQLCWLLMPCHLITMLWIYVFFSRPQAKNYNFCVYLASLATAFHWGPVSAAAFPDWDDHLYPIEGLIFLVHHGLLTFTPVYWAARYELLPLTPKFLAHLTMVATFINVGPYTIISYISGLNLNYHLYPPPKLMKNIVFATPYYRWIVIPGLIVLSILFWASTWFLGRICRLVASPFVGSSSSASSAPAKSKGSSTPKPAPKRAGSKKRRQA